MSKTRTAWMVWGLAFLMLIGFAGCGGKDAADVGSASSTASSAAETYDGGYAERMAAAGASGDSTEDLSASASDSDLSPLGQEAGGGEGVRPARAGRKLITTVHIDAESEDYDGFLTWLNARLDEAGGYIEHSEVYAYKNDDRSCQLTLRVPADKLDGFLSAVGENCNILQRSMSEEDVTLNYVDTQSHLEALRIEQERLLALLEKAESLEDIIILEERLTAVRYELQNYESALRTFDDQIDYGTVNISLREVGELTQADPETWGSRAITGIKGNAKDIGVFFQELGLLIVTNLPLLALLGAVVVVVLLLTAKRRRENRRKREEMLNTMLEKKQEKKEQ